MSQIHTARRLTISKVRFDQRNANTVERKVISRVIKFVQMNVAMLTLNMRHSIGNCDVSMTHYTVKRTIQQTFWNNKKLKLFGS